MADNSHKAPLTLKLIVRVNEILMSRGKTREALRVELNKFLPPKRQIKGDHSGLVKLNRWLNPTGNDWSEPRSEIALALSKWLDSKEK